jgi:hypothetical protein
MDAIGKTVKRIEEGPTGEYGYVEHDTVVIHFTDGTALKVEGSSYEDVSQSVTVLGRREVNALAHAAQGRRETARIDRLKRQEWLSISCEERGERKRAREAKMSPIAMVMRDTFMGAIADQIHASNRMFFGDRPERRVRQPCENCAECLCPNAPVKIIPAQKGIDPTAQYTVRVETGTLGS